MSTVHIRYTIDTRVTVDDPDFLLDALARARIYPEECASGIVAAAEKLNAAASDEFKMFTMVGEVTSEIIRNEVPAEYPEPHVVCEVTRVVYEEVPENVRAGIPPHVVPVHPSTLH